MTTFYEGIIYEEIEERDLKRIVLLSAVRLHAENRNVVPDLKTIVFE